MSQSVNTHLLNIEKSLHIIALQEIPVLPTSTAYKLFEVRKELAINILTMQLNPLEKDILVELIDSYNKNIRLVLGL